VVEFRNGSLESSRCRLTNSSISNYSPADINTDNKWISLYGWYNRVDHCSIQGKTNSGTTLVVWLTSHPNYHQVDHNYFGPRSVLGFNGGETIRVGTSDWSMFDSFTTVEFNLFDQCNGEIEVVSNKSCGNVYRSNTFRSCQGTLTLRHGNRCTVDGNFFLANNATNSGGIRIIGEDHVVINNYIANTGGTSYKAGITMMDGIPNSPLSGYFQVKRAKVLFNTLVDDRLTFNIGAGHDSSLTLPPLDCIIANNVIFGTSGPFFTMNDTPINMTYEGNIYYSATLGIATSGFTRIDPRLSTVGSDGLRRLSDTSPAINAASGSYPVVTTDMDGQERDAQADAGADEYSTGPVLRRPLTMADVGPVTSTTVSIGVSLASGWNLIANPVTTENDSVRALYPTALNGYAFSFDPVAGYSQQYTLDNGRGYWEKFPAAITQTVSGFLRDHDTVSVVPGWNLVGSISGTLDTGAIVSVPAGIKASHWFSFVSGYTPAATIVSGHAYWIKANAAGVFVLRSGAHGVGPNRRRSAK
jgi:poly(beta-D-mannuronate) lyase